MRNISFNTHYIILFQNTRDSQQISTLARQMYPENSQFLIEAYQVATKKPHEYLFIDSKPKTKDQLSIRTGILPNDKHYVYINKIVDEAELSQLDITIKMSKRLRMNEPFLYLLARSSAKRRKVLLKQATKEELASLFEICLNILRCKLQLSPHMHKKLKR